MHKTKLYFAYGANINLESMAFRCPDATPVKPLMLRDWELVFYSHATIEQMSGAVAPGVLWKITPHCEQTLDIFEGFPTYYTKRTWNQDGLEFFFYEMAHFRQGHPSVQYIDNILEGYDQWGIKYDRYATNENFA